MLAKLPLMICMVLVCEVVYFGVVRSALRRGLLPSAAAGLGIVIAWLAADHGSLGFALAGAGVALLAHGWDVRERWR